MTSTSLMSRATSLSLFFLLICFSLSAQHMLQGTVRNISRDGSPILPGANIVLNQSQGISSDKNGNFSFGPLRPGQYTITVSFIGFVSYLDTLYISGDKKLNIGLLEDAFMTEEIMVSATRADAKTPMSYSNVTSEELTPRNLGQDMPTLLNYMPSVVTTTDAGAGIGYSGIRVRGSDATRTNVTINGIPLNDSESSGVFWVNLPDLASSVEDIQLQRGVGTSTNGAGAFGASVNLHTTKISQAPKVAVDASYGSFNSQKYSGQFSSGIIKDHFEFSGRFSKIASDGYIERASADMESYFLNGSYFDDKTLVKLVAFGGWEKTYQSWNGIDQAGLDTNRRFNSAGALYDENWNVIGYYDNEVDDYQQHHFQAHINHEFNDAWDGQIALHYTRGKGFYEQYRQDADMIAYGMDPVQIGGETISTTDLIQQKWLDNHFYGFTFGTNYKGDKLDFTFGGAWNRYLGDHIGRVIWSRYSSSTEINHEFYDNTGDKQDLNFFAKLNYDITESLNAYLDVQYRHISYTQRGIHEYGYDLMTDDKFNFLNPKLGLMYQLNDSNDLYVSYARANKEPIRDDYINYLNSGRTDYPEHESLDDFELGWKHQTARLRANVNAYYMHYTNQLVLTGEINNVGEAIRENSGKSYRAGLEMDFSWSVTKWMLWQPNATLSINRNIAYHQESEDGDLMDLGNTPISYSPSVIAGNAFTFLPIKGLQLSLLSKYVGKQYMSNSKMESSILDDYFVTDFNASYALPKTGALDGVSFSLLINNIFNEMYSSNGYMWGETPYYYPQAGTNFLLGVRLEL